MPSNPGCPTIKNTIVPAENDKIKLHVGSLDDLLDQENQKALSDARLEAWLKLIAPEFGLPI